MTAVKSPRVILFSQGDEVLTGQTVDTNAAWLAEQLDSIGFEIRQHVTVGDRLPDLVQQFRRIAEEADLCICTGGLGPTQDDLTAEAVAQAFDRPLELDPVALQATQQFFDKRGVPMPEVNRKQAFLPAGCTRLDNPWGTASGFELTINDCRIICVPGVPYEMKQMFEQAILPRLREQFELVPARRIILRIIGMGESRIQELLNAVPHSPDIEISFRAGLPENELKLRFPASYDLESIRRCVQPVVAILGEAVYAVDGLDDQAGSLAQRVDQLMQLKRLNLAVVESITQGQIASQCAPDWLLQSLVFPQPRDALSHFDLSVSSSQNQKAGARQLAGRLKVMTGARLALAQLFEPDGADARATQLYTALAHERGTAVRVDALHGRAERQRILATSHALNLLRQVLVSE